MHKTRTLVEAAVLVPVLRRPSGETAIVLIRRTNHGMHAGQIAFPGGRRDPDDRSPYDTALREAEEEIGLPRAAIVHLADLEAIETHTTGFRIHPFLARVAAPTTWTRDAREVAEVIEAPVASLLEPGAHGVSHERFEGYPDPVRVAFYQIGDHRLWGATYRILHPLLPRLAAGEWSI